jgi:tetratricopeptide (TPR) repeat protein
VDEVWLPERKGSLGIELRAAARSRGLMAYPVESADHLFQELQANRPVLVMQNLALPNWPKWHFAVVTGYRNQGDTVVLHSGTTQSDTSHWNRFIRTWARADQWGFTLVAPGQLPASAEPDALLRAISALPNSIDFWPAAVEAFPQNGPLWFGYGNALWAQNKQAQARAAFEKAVHNEPELAAAWNNLAYAQLAMGEKQEASKSLCQALALAPDDPEIQASAREIGNQPCPKTSEPPSSSAAP